MNFIFFIVALGVLVYRAIARQSLTTSGIIAAVVTASAHALHPWNLPFILLITFYLLGTIATKVNHAHKATLTLSSTGDSNTGRTHVQVLANSAVATALALLHATRLDSRLLMVGIVANYAAVTADTLSSELGILSRSGPRLVTTLRRCAPGTNGGVTVTGVLAGAAGAAVIGAAAAVALREGVATVVAVTAVGTAGTLLDSVLGAVLQESVVDVRSGKVVEAPGGGRVLVGQGKSRRVVGGFDVLSNNGVNFAMAALTSTGAMVVAGMYCYGDALRVVRDVVG